MKYRLALTRRAEKQLVDLTQSMRRRVDRKLLAMAEDPYRGVVKLTQLPGFRARVGEYRILFSINDSERRVTVNQIIHRREAYR